jgi:GNAT superfamily N-acetyltransferase
VGAFYLRAEIAGTVVGQCMVTTEWSDWRNMPVWWLQSVYVAPAWRRRGVYRALHETVLDRARSAGAAGVRLYVDQGNDRAADVYRRVGMDGDHYLVFEQMFRPSVGDPDPDGP